MGHPLRSVIFNAREELISGDLNRAQQVLSKAIQDMDLGDALDTGNLPINGFVRVPTFAGVAATFNVDVGAGEARYYSVSGIGADDSAFRVLLILAQTLTHGAPDATNPRIDLIVAAPGTVESDASVRNVLTDPVARTFAPALLEKTSASIATLSVVAGVAGATPAAPAVPAGKVALREVWVPAAAADATAFNFIPRLFRRAPYPFTGLSGFAPESGVLRGCDLTHAAGFDAIGSGDNAVVIEGEVIEFGAMSDLGVNDTLGNPFAGAAGANADVPFFIYIVGGRGLPSVNFPASANANQPVCMVASTTPPNVKTGRPSSPIGAPRGSTSSAVFIGCGWKLRGTSNRQTVQHMDDWAWSTGSGGTFEQNNNSVASGSPAIPSAPSISDRIILGWSVTYAAAASVSVGFWTQGFDVPSGAITAQQGNVDVPLTVGAGTIPLVISVATNVLINPRAYRVPVRRFSKT